MEVKYNGRLIIIISDPFNKRYIERALGEIPYDKAYNRNKQYTIYRLKHSRRDGQTFVRNMEGILRELGMKMCFERRKDKTQKRKENLIFYDAESNGGKKNQGLNKPIIILLNHKENIRPEVKFHRFISKPDDWLITEGEDRLQGHIDRIRKYANERGFDNLISVYPVFLLPALMSSEQDYWEYSDLLWKSSNIDAFIDQLKLWIVHGGPIKRSQTIIDEAVAVFKQSQDKILQAESIINAQIDSLVQQRSDRLAKLRDIAIDVENRIREFLKEKYTNLATSGALAFAEEEYAKRGDFSEKWKQFVSRIDFENEVIDGINTELRVYQSKAQETVSELFEDFYFSVKSSFELSKIDIPISFNFKIATRLTGSALGIAGSIVLCVAGMSNPVGWILTGVGIAVGALSCVFKSKEKKRQQAINKIYNAIHDKITKSMDGEIEKTITEIEHSIQDRISQTDNLFADLIYGLQTNSELSEKLRERYHEQLIWLNKVYAWRILQFIQTNEETFSPENVNRDIIDVDRTIPGLIAITSSEEKLIDTSILKDVIAEEVKIEGRH